MRIKMNKEDLENNSSYLQIKELKEKVKSLVSEVDFNYENAKFKHDKHFTNNLSVSVSSDESEDEFFDCSEIELEDETNWLSEENTSAESVKDICQYTYSDVDDERPDISDICRRLESSVVSEPNIFSNHRGSIDSRTFTRPKKLTNRPLLSSVMNNGDDGRPRLQRRLTTTISPTPNLITKLEELSKINNRPVSGNYGDVSWQEGAEEGLAVINDPPVKIKRQSLPASLFDRLQELKRANSSFKTAKISETTLSNGRVEDYGRSEIMEDAKKVTAALDVDLNSSVSSSRLSEIFRNTQEYYSDDNESFISLDEVSGFCDRLTLSTDQSTYSSIVKEMEQHEICLFHRTLNDDKLGEKRLTFGGLEIPSGDFPKSKSMEQTQLIDMDNDLNGTYEIDQNEVHDKANITFEIKKNEIVSNHNIMNTTFDANRKSGLVDVILESDVLKNLSPNSTFKKESSNNNNNNKVQTLFEGNNVLNNTYDKFNGTLNQNELNALHTEKYSTKIFDSTYKKGEPEVQRFSNHGKKDSDQSEDDCMSTTSDHSYRSVESNSEIKTMEELKSIAMRQNKSFSSTPILELRSKLEFEVLSPIKMEIGDGESPAYSNPSSRGQSPRQLSAVPQQDGIQKYRVPSIKQPLKVPQRELKLKPALIRPTQNFKRPLSYARTSSEPSVPQKVESCQSAVSVPTLRPSGPTTVPSLTNIKPSSRPSGIPRPPTRLKQPQVRVNYSKK